MIVLDGFISMIFKVHLYDISTRFVEVLLFLFRNSLKPFVPLIHLLILGNFSKILPMNLPRKLITSKGGQPIPFTIVNRIAGISSLLNFFERGKEQKGLSRKSKSIENETS